MSGAIHKLTEQLVDLKKSLSLFNEQGLIYQKKTTEKMKNLINEIDEIKLV
jgi:hypothetical protein